MSSAGAGREWEAYRPRELRTPITFEVFDGATNPHECLGFVSVTCSPQGIRLTFPDEQPTPIDHEITWWELRELMVHRMALIADIDELEADARRQRELAAACVIPITQRAPLAGAEPTMRAE